jgi:Tfp pilus assembly protein PilX
MPESQAGAVLFTALVLMVLMTLLAVTMMGNTARDEKMAQNSQEQNRAFQAAETGIEMALANNSTLSTSNGFDASGNNTFVGEDKKTTSTGDDRVFSQNSSGDGYGVSIEYTSVFLQKTPVTRGSGFDSSFANYWFEIQSKARTDTGASSTVALGMFQVGSN